MTIPSVVYPLFIMVPGCVGAFALTTHFLWKDEVKKQEAGDTSPEVAKKIARFNLMQKIGIFLFPIFILLGFFGLIYSLYFQ